jgi:hypothetical protein
LWKPVQVSSVEIRTACSEGSELWTVVVVVVVVAVAVAAVVAVF